MIARLWLWILDGLAALWCLTVHRLRGWWARIEPDGWHVCRCGRTWGKWRDAE